MIYAAAALLAAAVILLTVRLCLVKASLREIRRELADKLHNDTNTVLTVSTTDRDVRALASDMNTELRGLREKRLQYELGSSEIKTAVTNISHDLRTPLTAICGHLELISRTDDPEKIQRYLGVISERAYSMKQLTEEMFRYSIILSQEESEDVGEVHVNQVLEECIAGCYPALMERGITPEIKITPERVMKTCSGSDLTRVFSNLLGNAVKYSDGDLSVELSADGVATFSNSAASLTEVQVEKLFDRFYTVEAARNSTGLGLSIARTLAERMGADVSASFENGRLTMTVRL